MSLPSAKITCTGCDFETREFFQPLSIVYRLESGKEIGGLRGKGWCFNCCSYRNIENIEPGQLTVDLARARERGRQERSMLAQLNRALIARLKNRTERKVRKKEIERWEREIRVLSALLELTLKRKSQPRCLNCWADQTDSLTFGPDGGTTHDFRHSCGGKLQIVHDAFGMRFSFIPTTYVLNEEGLLIEEIQA